jgi:hypothetical protein
MSDGVMYEPGKIDADEITVDGDDLETVDMIQAGLHPTAQQVATNEKGITSNQQQISANTEQIQANMSDIQQNTDRFPLSANTTLGQTPPSTSTSVAPSFRHRPWHNSNSSRTGRGEIKGCIIEVKGFADSTGSPAMNEQPSEDRADAVVSYLI